MAVKNNFALTNRQLIEVGYSQKNIVRCVITRPSGDVAFDEKMKVTAVPNKGKMTFVSFSLSGTKRFEVPLDDKRFDGEDRGYHFSAYEL